MAKKLYNKQIIAHIQNCLNTGTCEITAIESYEDLLPGKTIALGDIRVTFYKSTNPKLEGKYEAAAALKDDVSREYYKEWKTYPVGSHLIKDFKNLITDNNGNVPYKEILYQDLLGYKKRALVRHLFELDTMDADLPEAQEYYENYADLIHQNQCFLIIKIIPEEDKSYNRAEKVKISAIADFEYDPYNTTLIPISDENMGNSDYDSTPLFD